MKLVQTTAELRTLRAAIAGSVGVVPTMGALHAGHLALVQRAKAENEAVVVTVFVNPAQFNDPQDLLKYPRDLAQDAALLESAGVDVLFAPGVDEIYPPGYQTYVTVEDVTQPLEGARRPGHFRGVTTVVAKLFNLTLPNRAYFGQKDAQQVAVLQQMVRDLAFPLDIVVCPTVREPDGLALSSRNRRLTSVQRTAAPVVYRALQAAESAWAVGMRDAEALHDCMRDVLANEPLVQVDYISVADAVTLRELEGSVTEDALLSVAVYMGEVRLIDNIMLRATAV